MIKDDGFLRYFMLYSLLRNQVHFATQLAMKIKLRLFGKPAMYVKEYLYGSDQSITEIDKDTTILEFTAKYKYNTLQLVLGFGADCEVLEPEWLKKEVVDHCKKIQKMYD